MTVLRTLATPSPSFRHAARALALVLTLLALLVGVGRAASPAAASPTPPRVAARAYVVMDAKTGVVLAARNPDLRLPMASTTKIMTGLLALEHFNDLNAVIVAKGESVGVGESEIYLRKGEKLTVDQLLMAVMIQSANDAAVDLADGVAGSEEKFVRLMNERASELDLANTSFRNPHGLDEPGHYSSALDLTRLGRFAMQDDRFASYVSRYSATIPWAGHPYDRELVSHNNLLERYPWVDGIKTGFTDGAGYCVVASGAPDGRGFIVTVLGEPSEEARVTDAAKLFAFADALYERRPVAAAGDTLAHVAVPYHDEGLDLVTARSVAGVTREGAQIDSRVVAPSSVELPVDEGDRVGEVVYYADGVEIGRAKLVAARGFDEAGWTTRLGYQFHRAWAWTTGLF